MLVFVMALIFSTLFFSIQSLVLVTFYFIIFMCVTYCGVVEMMNVNKGRFVSVM